jgi:hypothetical protein
MSDTSGFYKNDNSQLLYGRNYVTNSRINLLREHKDTYAYPVEGWAWHDSEDAARIALNLPAPPTPTGPALPPWMQNINISGPTGPR